MRVYADNAATMRMRESAYNAMLPYLRENYANPSSTHEGGIRAHESVRISLSHENTEEEIDYMISNIRDCVSHLRSIRSVR